MVHKLPSECAHVHVQLHLMGRGRDNARAIRRRLRVRLGALSASKCVSGTAEAGNDCGSDFDSNLFKSQFYWCCELFFRCLLSLCVYALWHCCVFFTSLCGRFQEPIRMIFQKLSLYSAGPPIKSHQKLSKAMPGMLYKSSLPWTRPLFWETFSVALWRMRTELEMICVCAHFVWLSLSFFFLSFFSLFGWFCFLFRNFSRRSLHEAVSALGLTRYSLQVLA